MILTAEQIEILVERRKNGTLWAVTPDVVEAIVDSLVDLKAQIASARLEEAKWWESTWMEAEGVDCTCAAAEERVAELEKQREGRA